jgi:hypothetical protein
MPHWERKNAFVLADAIAKHIRNHPDKTEDNELLSIVLDAIDAASNTVNTTQGELSRQRAVVCAICRGAKLYECDVPEGWSPNCAFVFSNTTNMVVYSVGLTLAIHHASPGEGIE